MKDTIKIRVTGGSGGNGSLSLRREAFLPKGGPDGGDGGNGGDVIMAATSKVTDLSHFLGRRVVKGERGGNGGAQKRKGRDGISFRIHVPLGTAVWDVSEEESVFLGEVVSEGEEIIVANGGQGGRGNVHFATSINQTPMVAEAGQEGETREIFLELQLVVDVVMLGKPGSGKSQFIQCISSAKPEVADYPFTTREPVLATVVRNWQQVTFLELPGIVEGSSQGKGLGNAFLRHTARAKLILHFVDGSSPDPLADIREMENEMSAYDPVLMDKPRLVVINKCDLPEVAEHIPELEESFFGRGMVAYFISAQTGEGVEELLGGVDKTLSAAVAAAPQERQPGLAKVPVRRTPRPVPEVRKEGDVFVVISPQAERLMVLPDLRRFAVRLQLREQLGRLGVVKALEGAGVKQGDRVRIGEVEIQW